MNLLAKSRRPLHLLAILLIGVAGCGLSEYQSRMDAQRERVKEFDDANRGLDDPLEPPALPAEKPAVPPKDVPKEPTKEDVKPAWLFDFYLRLPKGFGSTPKDKAPIFYTFPCFRYAGAEPGHEIFVAAALVVDPKSKEKDEFGKYTPDNFRFWLRTAIKDFYIKTNNKLDLKLPEKDSMRMIEVKTLSPFSDVTTKVPYRYVEYSDAGNAKVKEPSIYRVYIHEEPANIKDGVKEPGKQIAIIVHRPIRTASDTFDKAVDACLGTLDTSDVTNKRLKYKTLMKR